MEAINYPKVVSSKDKKVYLDLKIGGNRMRLSNGSKFNIDLFPNSYPENQRINQANILAAQVYAKLLAGESPKIKNEQGVLDSQPDLHYIREALNRKLQEGFSKHYNEALKRAYLRIEACSKFGDVDEKTIELALDLYENNTSYNTLRRNMNILCRYAVKLGMSNNPVSSIKRKREKAKLNKPISDVPALLAEIRSFNENLHLCCLLTYGCLLRPHREVRELKWSDFTDDLSHIRLSGDRNKSGRNRIVPVPSYIKEKLDRKDGHLNIFSGTEQAFHPDYFKGLWSRFKRRSKLLEANQTIYSFRHTGAIDIYKRTGSIEKLKAAMGHSSVMVSLTYLRGLDVAELKEEDMPSLFY
jgi:integrase